MSALILWHFDFVESLISHQGERASVVQGRRRWRVKPAMTVCGCRVNLKRLFLGTTSREREWPKPPRPPAIRLIRLAEVAAEAPLFAAHLYQHDDHYHAEYQQGLPSPETYDGADVIDEAARQHGVAAQTIRPFRHQVLRARRYLMPESVHRVAVALAPHVNNGPNAERQPEHGQHDGRDQSRQRSVQGVGHP